MFGFGKKSAASKACAAYISHVAEQYDRCHHDLLKPLIHGIMDAGGSPQKVQEILDRGTHQYAFLIGIFFWQMAQMTKRYDESMAEIISEQFAKTVVSAFGDKVGQSIMVSIGTCVDDAQLKSMLMPFEEEEEIREFAVNRILFFILEEEERDIRNVIHSEKVVSDISRELENIFGDWWSAAKRSNAFGL